MRRGLIPIVWLAASLAVAAPAHAARAWDAPEPAVSGDGVPMVAPQARFTSQGELVAAWGPTSDFRYPPRPLRVAVQSPGSGGFGAAQTLDGEAGPTLSMDTDSVGGTTLAWSDGSENIRVAGRPAGGAFGPSQLFRGKAPDLAVNARGDAALAFAGPSGDPWLSFRPAGGRFGAPVLLAAGNVFRDELLDVDLSDDGRVVAVWQDPFVVPGKTVARAVVRMPDGSLTAPQTLSRSGWHDQAPQVAMGPRGEAMAVWNESPALGGGGPVMSSHLVGGCCFAPPVPVGVNTTRRGVRITSLEGSAAWLSLLGHVRNSATALSRVAVGANLATGALSGPMRLGQGFAESDPAAANARGSVLVAHMDKSGSLLASRRAPGAGFTAPAGVYCGGFRQIDAAAISPAGNGVVFFTPPSTGGFNTAPAMVVRDREAASGTDCRPPVKEALPGGRLALQARMPRGGRLYKGRWLRLRVFCGVACRLRTDGSVAIARRRKRLALNPDVVNRKRHGTTTVTVGLTRARARTVRRALARGRRVRARVRLRGRGGGATRTLTFKVTVRR